MARPKLGDSETERLHVKITADEIKAIDDWRYANRVPSRSEAVRRLCRMALIQEELKPYIEKNINGLIDAAVLLGEEALSEKPRMPEDDYADLHNLALDVFSLVYSLYDKAIEQTMRVSGVADGTADLKDALDRDARVGEFLEGKSLFASLKSPDEMKAIAQAVEHERNAKKDDGK